MFILPQNSNSKVWNDIFVAAGSGGLADQFSFSMENAH